MAHENDFCFRMRMKGARKYEKKGNWDVPFIQSPMSVDLLKIVAYIEIL